MRALIQRVTSASVSIEEKLISQIKLGLLVLLGIKTGDTHEDSDYIIRKIVNLRIFADEQYKMNKNLSDVGGEILLISQFTLYGDCKKGNRPSFIQAMPPAEAELFYNEFVLRLKNEYAQVKEGLFGASMQVGLVNDGPVTILIDSNR